MSALERAKAELAECDKFDIPSSRPSTLIVSDLRALVAVVEAAAALVNSDARQPNGRNVAAHQHWYDEHMNLWRAHRDALRTATGATT